MTDENRIWIQASGIWIKAKKKLKIATPRKARLNRFAAGFGNQVSG